MISIPLRCGHLVGVLLLGLAAACRPTDPRLSPGGYYGAELPVPRPKPDFTLTATDGSRFHFRDRTDGYVTLLFFGYTRCPDVCPVHMANLAAVMKRLPVEVANRIRVVFVTTDPARDTPARLRTWLGAFDPTFIGLTGTDAEIRAAEAAAGLPPAQRDTTGGPDYTVGHAAFVIGYTRDGLERVMYPFGTRQSDWAHDLPRLVAVSGPRVEVDGAYVLAAPGSDVAAAYFKLVNRGPDTVTIRAASAEGAAGATFHIQRRAGNVVRMQPLGAITLLPGRWLALEPNGTHLMLTGLSRPLASGDTVRIRLEFDPAGDVRFAAPVRSYGDGA